MARTYRYELDMMMVRLDWLTERQEAYENSWRRALGLMSEARQAPERPELRPDGRPALTVLKGGRA
jgi:hypothetical protein